jgi:muramoyltetrapeptide carboxypeptidase
MTGGDTLREAVYVWAPAYGLADANQLKRAMAASERFGEAVALAVEASPSLATFSPRGGWSEAVGRRSELDHAFSHRVLLAARGGYGCVELATAALAHRERPGTLIGYSDLTVLHAIWRRKGWGETLYGFMPAITDGARALASTVALFRGQPLELSPASDSAVQVLTPGRGEGVLFAACLRVLASMVGTPAMPSLAGTVLALEDIDERPYQIARDLEQLAASGALDDVRALVFGAFPCATTPAGYAGPSAAAVCARMASQLRVPAVFGLPFGHHGDPVTLPCSRPCVLAAEDGSWRLSVAPR